MSFNKAKSTMLWTPRPRNVVYSPSEGETWLYFDDTHDQDVIEWLILEIGDTDHAVIEKRTGKQIGYRTSYKLSTFHSRRWKPKDPSQVKMEILWPCPNCEEDRPILIGDYICEECRAKG